MEENKSFKEKLKEKLKKIGGYLKKKEVFSKARKYKSMGNHKIEDSVSASLEEKIYQTTESDGSKTHIDIPYGYTSIEDRAFAGCSNLQSITIPDSVTSIGNWAFMDCSSLETITIPESVTSIGDCAFERCSSLQSITIPDGVTLIGRGAFKYCSSLQSITIPDSVTSIGDYAFSGCSALESVKIPKHLTEEEGWKERIFGDMLPENIEIYDKAEVKTDKRSK